MFTDIFCYVLMMSAVGSVATVILLALKPLTERAFGARWQFYMWCAVLLIMLVPLRLELGVRLPQAVSLIPKIAEVDLAEDILKTEYSIKVVEQQAKWQSVDLTRGCAIVWVIVAVFTFVKVLFKNAMLKKTLLKNSRFCRAFGKAEIRECGAVGAPLLLGVMRPMLYIPEGLDKSECMEYVIAHESVHIRRKDVAVKWLGFFVKCIHWFNPLVYILVRRLGEYCEISCDIEAVRTMNEEMKRAYMKTILSVSQKAINFRSSVPSVGLSTDGRQMKKRFTAIKKAHKSHPVRRFLSMTLASVFIASVICIGGIAESSAAMLPRTSDKVLTETEGDTTNNEVRLPATEAQEEYEAVAATEEVGETEAALSNTDSLADIPNEPQNNAETSDYKPSVIARQPVTGEFNSDGGDTRAVRGIKPDENGRITVKICSNAKETVDIYFNCSNTGKTVYSCNVPIDGESTYVFEAFDRETAYDVVLKGTLRNDWKIESKYYIY